MRTAIIAEYNPFHNGHKYQIETLKKAGYNEIIIFISGNFVQRGEAAIQDKITRAKHAIDAGADLVIQVPTPIVLQSAGYYCENIVKLIADTKLADSLSFGIWQCSKDELITAAMDLDNPINKSPKLSLNNSTNRINTKIFSSGNNLLAAHYINSIMKNNLLLKPNPIERIASIDNSKNTFEGFASASIIRNMLTDNMNVNSYVPNKIELSSINNIPQTMNLLCEIFMYKYFNGYDFTQIPSYENGIEKFISTSLINGKNFNEISSKKYSNSRIKRFITQSALDITKNILQLSCRPNRPLRVLGANRKGISIISENTKAKFIMNPSNIPKNKSIYHKLYKIETLATNLYYRYKPEHANKIPEYSISTYYKKD